MAKVKEPVGKKNTIVNFDDTRRHKALITSNEKKSCCTCKCCGIAFGVIFACLVVAGGIFLILAWKGYVSFWVLSG